MLRLSLPSIETYREEPDGSLTVDTLGGIDLSLEYSLYTISLWESKWKKPFLESFKEMTVKTRLELYKCMCMTPDVPDSAWLCLTANHHKEIMDYISDPMSATTVTNHAPDKPGKKKVITTEQIYYWMASLGIPFECEHWHFNRLMKLIQVGMISQAPPKKMGKREAAQYQREVFARNRAKYNSRG